MGAYDEVDLSFGIMVHGITYPDEAVEKDERNQLAIRLWNAQMRKGIINFPRPEECEIRRNIGAFEMKKFGEGNFSGLDEFKGGE